MHIGVAVLGFAHGHVGMYCSEWRAHPELGVRVLAGWDHEVARLEKATAEHGLRACATVEELLAGPDVQAVVIGAETAYHADLVERVAQAGKAIVLQKPIALTLAEADRIVAAVQRHGVPFTLAWQMRVDPQNLQMRALVQSGVLGRPFMVRRRHGLNLHLWPSYADLWHVRPELNRDIWADDASHAVDFIHWLLGVPEAVTAEIASLYDPRVPMDNGVAVYRYAGGPLAEVCCSFTCPAGENTTEIVCERGVIVQNYGDLVSCNVPRPEGACGLKWYSQDSKSWTCSDIPTPAQHGARIRGLAAPLAEFLQGRRGPIATAEEGRTTLRMTLAGHLATREGRRVRIDDEGIARI